MPVTRSGRRATGNRAGFTIIELMVVIGIIIVAAGMMAPTVTDFLQNRKIEGVRGSFSSTFNRARLRAVNQRAHVSLVFFREGVRIFDNGLKQFLLDDFFNENSVLSTGDIWFEFGFLDGRTSLLLPRYREWEAEQLSKLGGVESGAGGAGLRHPLRQYSVSDLPRVTFERDGTLFFATGVDVSSAEYKNEPPGIADIMIKQRQNPTVVFIDLRTTGQIRSKALPLDTPPEPPMPETEGGQTQ